jgi:hypothetical protein
LRMAVADLVDLCCCGSRVHVDARSGIGGSSSLWRRPPNAKLRTTGLRLFVRMDSKAKYPGP